MKRSPLNPMSDRRRAKLAAAGVVRPFSTLTATTTPTSKPAGKRPSGSGPDAATVALVVGRDGGCVRCGAAVRGVRGIDWSAHHRRLRSAGGDNSPANLIVLCGHGTAGCHGLVHSRPGLYRREGGWILRSTDDPAAYPVVHARLGFVFLDTAGGSSTSLTEAGAA